MAEKKTQAEKDFLAQVCRFAESKAVNGVLLEKLYSGTIGAPVLLLFAIGEQAMELERIVMNAAMPPDPSRIVRATGGSEFLR
jgi:hypothetical protein